MREPRVRKDGLCAQKGCSNKLPRSKMSRRYAGHWLDLDPFCSTRCCRRFHGTELTNTKGLTEAQIQAREEAGRRGSLSWNSRFAA